MNRPSPRKPSPGWPSPERLPRRPSMVNAGLGRPSLVKSSLVSSSLNPL